MEMEIKACELVMNELEVKFADKRLEDIEKAVSDEMRIFSQRIKPGMTVAVTCGSRGIDNIARIIRAVCDELKKLGAEPFVIPAMGSHGGATAEGQRAVLAGYGVTEEYIGVPIKSSMEVADLGDLPENPEVKVYMDKYAYEADGVFVVNRVKAHTDFHGANESGLVKMLVIGLGKHKQALAAHAYGVRGLRENIPAIAREIVKSGKIVGGLGIVEDGYDRTSIVKAAFPEDIHKVDSELLAISKEMLPALPFGDINVLVVKRIGKEISGTGMDPNITGRTCIRGEADARNIGSMCVLDITEGAHGNAIGIGMADVTTRRLFDKIDFDAMYTNVITSRFFTRGFVPLVAADDRTAIETAIFGAGRTTKEKLTLAIIEDTLHIGRIWVTDALLEEALSHENVRQTGRRATLSFDDAGNLK